MTDGFKVGDKVEWSSQSHGSTRLKIGTVHQVVAVRDLPNRDRFPQLYKGAGVGFSRYHVSYVVMVGKKPYWPRVKNLKLYIPAEDSPEDGA